MHPDIKIQVSCANKQSILGSSSTILHPFTKVRDWKNCSHGQQAKSVDPNLFTVNVGVDPQSYNT